MTYGPGQLVLVTAESAGAVVGAVGWYVNAGALVVPVDDALRTATPDGATTPTREPA